MTRFSGIRGAVWGLLAVLVLGWLVTASSASPPTEQQPRVDAFGDPLPKHAIARIGTVRFRQTAEVTSLLFSPDFSPDGSLLALAGRGTGIRIHAADTGKAVARFGEEEVEFTHLAFSPDGKRLAAASGHAVRTWDIARGKELLLPSPLLRGILVVAFSPDGKHLAFGDSVWLRMDETATGRQVWRCPDHGSWRITFAPDGKTLAGGNLTQIRFHDAATGRMTHSLGKDLSPFFDGPIEYLIPHPDLARVVSLRIDSDPEKVTRSPVRVRKARTGEELFKFEAAEGEVSSGIISPAGRFLALVYTDGPIRFFQLANGKAIRQLTVPGTGPHRLAFAPDGRMLASADSKGGSVQLLEASTGGQRLNFKQAIGLGGNVVFSPSGDVLVTWGGITAPGTIYLWDSFTGRELGRLEGHDEGRVNRAVFSPDGKTLATADSDATILLWDVAGFVQRARPIPLSPEALAAAWDDLASPDAARAYHAMARCHQAGAQTVAFLRSRLRVEQAAKPEQVRRWLKDLDHDDFAVRERATQELEKHLEVVAPALRQALAAGPSPEVRRRLTPLIETAETAGWSGESLRTLRAIEILERLGLPEGRSVLAKLAAGPPGTRLTDEAGASLRRLGLRGLMPPACPAPQR